MLLGEFAAAMLVLIVLEFNIGDGLTLTKRVILFIITSVIRIYLDEHLHELE
jgi:hypothetical protein